MLESLKGKKQSKPRAFYIAGAYLVSVPVKGSDTEKMVARQAHALTDIVACKAVPKTNLAAFVVHEGSGKGRRRRAHVYALKNASQVRAAEYLW